MRRLIAVASDSAIDDGQPPPPRVIVQFWDDPSAIPTDIQECLDSWSVLEEAGFKQLLFDDVSAARFIEEHLSDRHVAAFQKCSHPAMRSDYFRYSFILKVGGFYVDADDVYLGEPVDALVGDGLLKLQPLCQDVATVSMVDARKAAMIEHDAPRVFYVANTPLIAPAGHPVIAAALERATSNVLLANEDDRDIQSLTGPVNLTACLVRHAIALEKACAPKDFQLTTDWQTVAISKWPLAYRFDQRNWRIWGQGDA
jgi:mannosyltransferase OCH1-like enzyme